LSLSVERNSPLSFHFLGDDDNANPNHNRSQNICFHVFVFRRRLCAGVFDMSEKILTATLYLLGVASLANFIFSWSI